MSNHKNGDVLFIVPSDKHLFCQHFPSTEKFSMKFNECTKTFPSLFSAISLKALLAKHQSKFFFLKQRKSLQIPYGPVEVGSVTASVGTLKTVELSGEFVGTSVTSLLGSTLSFHPSRSNEPVQASTVLFSPGVKKT